MYGGALILKRCNLVQQGGRVSPCVQKSDIVDQSVATFRAGIGDAVGDELGEGDMAELTRLHRTAIRSLVDEIAKLREAAASGVAASSAFDALRLLSHGSSNNSMIEDGAQNLSK